MAKRDPLNGKLVVLLGGTGFVGTHLAQDLLARGARLRIASRHPERAYKLKPLGNLGQIQFVACDVTKPDTIRAVLTGADAAIYLVGSFSGNLASIQAKGAGTAAQAAAEAGLESFVLVSALGADAASEAAYARTKAEGEAAVIAAFPKATIIRPGVLFAEDDKFVNLFAGLISAFPVLPVFGPEAKVQPLWVDDAAQAIGNALGDPKTHGGKTYEIAGPEAITMGQLHRMIAKGQERSPLLLDMPDAMSALFAALPGTPMNRDQWIMLKSGSVPSGKLPGLKALGVVPKPLDLFMDKWMVRYRKHGRFGTKISAVKHTEG
ncbi:complex I NDUFA9 subunit family protein [Altererythrobacter sp. CC-YST694]|uniref:complex I NDUFA9 subunit family protein n=1 Tax=Altererythrobacter sp. CC-YST694 TaxID=2755038 RepID=UPI001D02B455|nr:complex I NDUFA9 subunit family protein [Altererythrobacter sp. CC-YST694]MCB5425717.1 complex I NDUFA9 subunit family protein [Altererythrobacter sp. CC-YST694]